MTVYELKDNDEYPEHAVTIAIPGHVTAEIIHLAREVYQGINPDEDAPAKYVQAWLTSQEVTAREIAGSIVAIYSREVVV